MEITRKKPATNAGRISTLGRRIKFFRERDALTQPQLSHAINVSVPQISRWENNKERPNQTNLSQLASFFKINVRQMTVGDSKPSESDKAVESNLGGKQRVDAQRSIRKGPNIGFAKTAPATLTPTQSDDGARPYNDAELVRIIVSVSNENVRRKVREAISYFGVIGSEIQIDRHTVQIETYIKLGRNFAQHLGKMIADIKRMPGVLDVKDL